jgi:hypothetical protein
MHSLIATFPIPVQKFLLAVDGTDLALTNGKQARRGPPHLRCGGDSDWNVLEYEKVERKPL